MRSLQPIVSILLLLAVTARSAHAYIDPGTGSYLLQLLAAAVLGSLFGIKMAWQRIVDTVRGLLGKQPLEDEADDDL